MSFSPPSDWVDEGGSGRRWWMIILGAGGGCLALVLIGGLLMTFGTCTLGKGCCDDIESGMKSRMAPVQVMLDKLGSDDVKGAYEGLGESFKEANTFEAFEGFIEGEGDLFRGGQAEFVRTKHARGTGRFYLTVQIKAAETRTVKGYATFLMSRTGQQDAQGAPLYVINEVHVGVPSALMEKDTILLVLQSFVDQLGRGDFEAAHRHFADGNGMDRATFRTFVKSQGELLMGGRVEVLDLQGKGPSLEALVEIRSPLDEVKGQAAFGMARDKAGQWRIISVRTVQADERAPEPEEQEDKARENEPDEDL